MGVAAGGAMGDGVGFATAVGATLWLGAGVAVGAGVDPFVGAAVSTSATAVPGGEGVRGASAAVRVRPPFTTTNAIDRRNATTTMAMDPAMAGVTTCGWATGTTFGAATRDPRA